tara:strand:+ start:1583 stop:1900 length:318 start_codon:yes stop_codon:yes gene_type:complete
MSINIYINDDEIVIKEKKEKENPWKRKDLFKGCDFSRAKINRFNPLGWTYRAMRVLDDAKIETYHQLSSMTELDLLKTRNCGRKTLEEINLNLAILGLELRKENE